MTKTELDALLAESKRLHELATKGGAWNINAFDLHNRAALPALVAEVERLRRCLDQAITIQGMVSGEGMDGNPCTRSFGMGFLRDISHCPDLYAELKAREEGA